MSCIFTGWASRSSRLPGGQSSGARSASSPLPQGKQESPGFNRESTSIPQGRPPYVRAQWRDEYPPTELARLKELVDRATANHVRFASGISFVLPPWINSPG
ncbi:beta-N-acetylglucosaminidase domain-containing protein [Streptomyces sp. NBC_00019]|uniref:beta-N-acetylglucosaminidase domain-containing protein n=1 Tax=Streptomyces sp. NBC_00019 TaxID=2975623 RepID=UPI0032510601